LYAFFSPKLYAVFWLLAVGYWLMAFGCWWVSNIRVIGKLCRRDVSGRPMPLQSVEWVCAKWSGRVGVKLGII